MATTYRRLIERQADGTYLIGLRGEDGEGRNTRVWRRYATKPDLATFKLDFTKRQKDDKDKDIPGTALRDQLDTQLAKMAVPTKAADETPKDNTVTFS